MWAVDIVAVFLGVGSVYMWVVHMGCPYSIAICSRRLLFKLKPES